MGDRFVLQLPSSPEQVGTARIFVGAVARQLGVDEEGVDNLKLAVSELCAAGVREGGEPLRVVLEWGGDALAVEVEGAGEGNGPARHEGTPDSFARSVGLDVVRSLFPDAATEDAGPGRRRVRFVFGS